MGAAEDILNYFVCSGCRETFSDRDSYDGSCCSNSKGLTTYESILRVYQVTGEKREEMDDLIPLYKRQRRKFNLGLIEFQKKHRIDARLYSGLLNFLSDSGFIEAKTSPGIKKTVKNARIDDDTPAAQTEVIDLRKKKEPEPGNFPEIEVPAPLVKEDHPPGIEPEEVAVMDPFLEMEITEEPPADSFAKSFNTDERMGVTITEEPPAVVENIEEPSPVVATASVGPVDTPPVRKDMATLSAELELARFMEGNGKHGDLFKEAANAGSVTFDDLSKKLGMNSADVSEVLKNYSRFPYNRWTTLEVNEADGTFQFYVSGVRDFAEVNQDMR